MSISKGNSTGSTTAYSNEMNANLASGAEAGQRFNITQQWDVTHQVQLTWPNLYLELLGDDRVSMSGVDISYSAERTWFGLGLGGTYG